MGTQSNLYTGQPGDTSTTLVTSPAATVTTITYAEAYNTAATAETLDLFFGSTQIAKGVTLGPYETVTLHAYLGTVLDAADTLDATASTAATINVKIDGYKTA